MSTYASQPRLFEAPPPVTSVDAQLREAYEVDGATSCNTRVALEAKYARLLEPTSEFNRTLVSYQANKKSRLHSWFKYKEGFSAQLVRTLLAKFGIHPGHRVLDPFAGSATTLLVAKEMGIDAAGIEILPMCHLAWEVKSRYDEYDLQELRNVLAWVKETKPGFSTGPFPHLVITESAFSPEREANLIWYLEQLNALETSALNRSLLRLVLMSILEDISFTRKDGQYLRWDSAASKAQLRDSRRVSQGKAPFKSFNKGHIRDVKDALFEQLSSVITDIESLQHTHLAPSRQEWFDGSVLDVLPKMDSDQFDAVVTSPPYCNRYDYTRTYALELAFLGVNEQGVRDLRQQLLSCTVESRSKMRQLAVFYESIGRKAHFERVAHAVGANAALQETFAAVRIRGQIGHLNNLGVVRMIEGYFTELAFVIFELFRTCRPGARVAMVNDNVRYGGEIIPVDMLTTDIAADFGFEPETIYVLPQRKGNSSQQMGKYGREALRKSITVWRK
jgi:site-specific DNA-methyltransferase (cytosine-N4-specific)